MTSLPHSASPPVPAYAWSVAAAALSTIGRVRKTNEDVFCADESLGLFIVSDGMGGGQAGDVAARLVTVALSKMVQRRMANGMPTRSPKVRSWLRQEMLALSQMIFQQGAKNPMSEGMGATVVLALLSGRSVHIAHSGDSRAYLFRNGRLSQMTHDHSIVAMLVREGEITARQAKSHPARGHLTRFMGMKDAVYADVRSVRVQSGDRLLLCSDGLFGMIPARQIRCILNDYVAVEQACEELVRAAEGAGGCDNITALVINFEKPGPADKLRSR